MQALNAEQRPTQSVTVLSELDYGTNFTESPEILNNDDLINNTYNTIKLLLDIIVSRKHKVPLTLYQLKYLEKYLEKTLEQDS